jgi:hypothetical protein
LGLLSIHPLTLHALPIGALPVAFSYESTPLSSSSLSVTTLILGTRLAIQNRGFIVQNPLDWTVTASAHDLPIWIEDLL